MRILLFVAVIVEHIFVGKTANALVCHGATIYITEPISIKVNESCDDECRYEKFMKKISLQNCYVPTCCFTEDKMKIFGDKMKACGDKINEYPFNQGMVLATVDCYEEELSNDNDVTLNGNDLTKETFVFVFIYNTIALLLLA